MREIYRPGELPPLGEVPPYMHAAMIRQERYGEPEQAIRIEVTEVQEPGPGQVLVLVMAAGVNYNNVWAALGSPVDVIGARQKAGAQEDFHIGGSDGAGIVWAVGEGVSQVSVGDHIVIAPVVWDERAADIRMGADPMTSSSALAMGYESNYGSFAQFTVLDEYQCHPKPPQLTWEEAGCFLLTAATVYRQLRGWQPHVVEPGDPVLIWGGAGGLGSMAIQIVRQFGGIPVAVVSDPSKEEHCLRLGAKGVINRKEFDHWGRIPSASEEAAYARWLSGLRGFGRRIWEVLGERRSPRIVLEHPGEDTIPTSMYVCDNAGMVVTCGGTSGYSADVDLRFLWMRQKRLQGSHGANTSQFRAVTELAAQGGLNPCLSAAVPFERTADVHQVMYENRHPAGNQAILIGAAHPGLVGLPG
ncbi:crotonyl-CoA carboxylase/reductase [Streptomyces sp. S.PNR 29]|uniref:crotonyl-CoA carboxylase/reductase n=1 Tax=Streptomyces sp. S.PNR 29 TaxID=2973805 RepID=UPI0025B1E7E9|nr:crotonyl-CoA carboxylase/reductase [Streptomyces sp. S.PNR 29]MDN0200021.1 crotonyl-CoA carboxylase/reductase [Streptomyces sp. S.PNR 29]